MYIISTKLCKSLSYFDKFILLKPHNNILIMWPTWGHVAIQNIYISTFTRHMTSKLSSGHKSLAAMLKSLSSSY